MSVRVVARIRPLLEKELDRDIIVHAASSEDGKPCNVVKIPNPKNEAEEFSFARQARPPYREQEEKDVADFRRLLAVNPHLKSLFQGLDVTIFAYGVTGTGKTHTMRGGLKLADRGVIPRLLSGVFRRAKKLAKDTGGDTTVAVALSYYEIYNDKVFDLLEPPEKRTPSGLPLREANGKTQVVGLSERACEDLKDFERLYIEANNNRITASTKLNAHSSRSHAILRVKVTQITGDMVRESTASAIDLAGSEDNRRTENGKERLIESAAINKSLFVLSQCIDAISRGDRRIPFRESKMTRILSLGQNNGITVMILNLAPIRSYHLDTLSSLNVSSRAKRIEVREIENEVVFKQPPRTNSSSNGFARQPLRPLANAHNIHSGTAAANSNKSADRPVKAFNVYTDRSKPAPTSRPANTAVKRRPSIKRPSDTDNSSRPSKLTRPAVSTTGIAKPAPQAPSISAEQIEAMVEKKVQEILASRTAAQESARTEALPPPEINEAVQKRLEALERRIEDHDRQSRDGDTQSSEGLRFLLQARQHKERGDDTGALRLYEAALPFFPGQAKLLGKIEKLRAKLGVSGSGAEDQFVFETKPSSRRAVRQRDDVVDDDEEYSGDTECVDDEDRATSPGKTRRKARRKERSAKAASSINDDEPAARVLLEIINSRDATAIMGLQGFGPKKARDLVEHLGRICAGEGGGIESLAQLRAVPGMGGRAVDRACEGLAVGLAC
ncbi:hypothetical protein DL764_000954 [Monosporascus ibericus]|uniref:Kinesin motor domain-containing protein n=1 Tax=Monosporascus ibericus TaxID=155417 RepID=A0A4Q4TRL1_9PEZI|nr:hypothetical protein DL764_000954 [Monosporascus ibericus]